MKLYLMRHGQAEPSAANDSLRQLTEHGQKQARQAASWLAKTVQGPVSLWVSPYVRTQQTATPIAQALAIDIINHDGLMPDKSAQQVIDELIHQPQDIILVTHLPLVGHLASLLVEGRAFDQSWSPAEIWQLQGEVFAAGCLEVFDTWYPMGGSQS